MIKYKLPIIIIDKNGCDLNLYNSEEEMGCHLEVIDIINDEYEAFDSEGCYLSLGIAIKKIPILFGLFKKNIKFVVVEQSEYGENHKQRLINALIDFITKFDISYIELQDCSLEQLIKKTKIIIKEGRL